MPKPEKVGTYDNDKTLLDICNLADAVVEEMRTYNIVGSNCQDFCNKLLTRLGFGTFPTMVNNSVKPMLKAANTALRENIPQGIQESATATLNMLFKFEEAVEVYIPTEDLN